MAEHDPVFTCAVCGDDFDGADVHSICPEHVFCFECVKRAVERSMENIDEFPARCCFRPGITTEIDIREVNFLFSDEFVQRYNTKLEELHVPPKDRVYCANPACAKFQSPFRKKPDAVTIQCSCGTTTCYLCKHEYLDGHVCTTASAPKLPPYSQDCRIKECPKCSQVIELRDACNHMTGSTCRHDFCFICLLPWTSGHPGCPYWGEMHLQYDAEGYELSKRELHVRTGLNRQGFNRLGRHFTDPNRNDTSVDAPDRIRRAPRQGGFDFPIEDVGRLLGAERDAQHRDALARDARNPLPQGFDHEMNEWFQGIARRNAENWGRPLGDPHRNQGVDFDEMARRLEIQRAQRPERVDRPMPVLARQRALEAVDARQAALRLQRGLHPPPGPEFFTPGPIAANLQAEQQRAWDAIEARQPFGPLRARRNPPPGPAIPPDQAAANHREEVLARQRGPAFGEQPQGPVVGERPEDQRRRFPPVPGFLQRAENFDQVRAQRRAHRRNGPDGLPGGTAIDQQPQAQRGEQRPAPRHQHHGIQHLGGIPLPAFPPPAFPQPGFEHHQHPGFQHHGFQQPAFGHPAPPHQMAQDLMERLLNLPRAPQHEPRHQQPAFQHTDFQHPAPHPTAQDAMNRRLPIPAAMLNEQNNRNATTQARQRQGQFEAGAGVETGEHRARRFEQNEGAVLHNGALPPPLQGWFNGPQRLGPGDGQGPVPPRRPATLQMENPNLEITPEEDRRFAEARARQMHWMTTGDLEDDEDEGEDEEDDSDEEHGEDEQEMLDVNDQDDQIDSP